ncbi:farnesol dehydrogenase-like [Schistocerca nitens]|uniref:farnesol dehydrogenase-like n=1 Tax=Schistocerca nitens TaxID=7011 RepID=UPI0021180100|nr:farnesol dehydrogenase-like [Schistocerca nitens]
METYAGRVALVTGASSGIGAAVVQALLRKGLTVVGLARRVDRIKALELKDAPGKLYAVEGDVTKEESITSAFKWISDNLGGVDVLVNNAGVYHDGDLTLSDTEAWRRTLEVNVLGLCICTREAVQDMFRRGVDDGFIVHIGSVAGHCPPDDGTSAMYSASKHAVRVLLDGLRKDLVAKKSKIRVGEISPGLVNTEIITNSTSWTPDIFEELPHMEPEDVADALLFMLSRHPRVQVYDIVMYPTGSE